MAVIEEQVFTILCGIPPLVDLVPTSRIKVPGDWQNLARPYIVHFPVSPVPSHVHDDSLIQPGIWDFYQVSVVSDSYSQGREVVDLLIENFRGNLPGGVTAFLRPGAFYIGSEKIGDRLIENFALNFCIAEGL
jgi:hypothetical protein